MAQTKKIKIYLTQSKINSIKRILHYLRKVREKRSEANQFNETEHKNSQAVTKIGSKISFLVRQSVKNEGIIL